MIRKLFLFYFHLKYHILYFILPQEVIYEYFISLFINFVRNQFILI